MSEYSKGPSYGSLSLSMGHSGARPMEHMQGDMGPVFTQPPMESHAQTGGRVSGNAEAPGPAWDVCFRAPMATPTRGTKNY
jgi:hypothetical protein